MIKRKIDSFLSSRLKNDKKALLITGARQIGKTYSIRHVGKKMFENFIEINFIETPEAAGIFSGAKDASEILFRLSSIAKGKIVPGKTLVFFDEVQECPEVVTQIKFLVEDGTCQYVLSGSLLGVELKDLRSEPVGYMSVKEMYPIDFQEFAIAMGVGEHIIDNLRECYENLVPVDDFIHNRMMALFRLYLIVGGMPAVVSKYLETNNMQSVIAEQHSILDMYRRDISKYDPQNKLYLNEIFSLIPSELNAKNKRFILKDLNENLKYQRYENSFLWMRSAGVALPTYNVEEPRVPLLLSKQRNLFKLFQSDVGLLASQYASGMQLEILNGATNINYGSIYENVAAQELAAHGFDLYYFNSKRQGELDFIIEDGKGRVLPIEIKSGKDYMRHNALSNVMSNPEYNIDQAIVFCNDNISCKDKVLYAPIYMLMFVAKPQVDSVIYRFDMHGLL